MTLVIARLVFLFGVASVWYVPEQLLNWLFLPALMLALLLFDRNSVKLTLIVAPVVAVMAGAVIYLIEHNIGASLEAEAMAIEKAKIWFVSLLGAGYVLSGKIANDILIFGLSLSPGNEQSGVAIAMTTGFTVAFGWVASELVKQQQASQFRLPTRGGPRIPIFSSLIDVLSGMVVGAVSRYASAEDCLKIKAQK